MSPKPWVLVTGASGFVGARLVRLLAAEGERVRAFVRPGARLDAFAGLPRDRFELAFGDVTIEHTVYRALAGCDRMYHLASVLRYWDARPERILYPATEGTRCVLRAAAARALERVVVTSSVAVLGTTAEAVLMDEAHVSTGPEPDLYALAKRRALAVTEEAAARGLPVVVVMPSGLAGPGDRRPTPVGAMIARYLNARFRTPTPPGGASVADVDDVARGHLMAMERGVPGQRYILGGENVTYEGLIIMLSELTGLPPPRPAPALWMVLGLARVMEVGALLTGREPALTRSMARGRYGRYSWVTSAKAERMLGYVRRPLTETLRRTVGWFISHGRVPERLGRRLRYELEAR
ncbi:MAG: NAD-dependent epimerase/dehydratase family protein [Polyangiaceae bacterium]|nr:NAD-dependent epimerase/dehydratase family protein [Polyangiaceae bacterium]